MLPHGTTLSKKERGYVRCCSRHSFDENFGGWFECGWKKSFALVSFLPNKYRTLETGKKTHNATFTLFFSPSTKKKKVREILATQTTIFECGFTGCIMTYYFWNQIFQRAIMSQNCNQVFRVTLGFWLDKTNWTS